MHELAKSRMSADRRSTGWGLRLSYRYFAALAVVVDWFSIALGSQAGSFLYTLFWRTGTEMLDTTLSIAALSGILFLFLANHFQLYRLPALLRPERYLQSIVFSAVTMCIMLTFILYFLHIGSEVPRIVVIYFTFLAMISLLIARLLYGKLLNRLLARGAIVGRRAIIIGERDELDCLSPAKLLIWFGFKEVSRVLLPTAAGAVDVAIDEKVADAISIARERRAEELVVAIAWNRIELLEKVNGGLRASPLPVRLLPDRAVSAMMGDRLASANGPMIAIELQRATLSALERQAKRSLDLVLACFALVLLWPIMAMAAFAVRLDSRGPIFFRQQRTGFHGDRFRIYKFRTMTVLEDGEDIVQAKPGDARITRVGAFLRRSSIDELPQLFNVLLGDMSLVGPRPHALTHDRQYQQLISKYAFRFHVKPGITGWAQVNGLRGETARLKEMEKRIEMDLWYINNWSFGLDLWILLRTSFEVAKSDAY